IDDRHRERERRQLINAVGGAMDTETSVAARRDVFVRTLVDEGFVDLARLVDMVGTPRTVAVAATRPEDADVLWGLDPPRSLDQSLIGAGGAQLITVDDAYLAGIAGAERRSARTRPSPCRCGRAAGWWACSSPGGWATRRGSRRTTPPCSARSASAPRS